MSKHLDGQNNLAFKEEKNMRAIQLFLFLLILFLTGIWVNSCVPLAQKQAAPRPNIILIMSDDQGWYDVGFNGNTDIKTPETDKLAAGGIIFDRFYSASPVCSPTRASLITGRNPFRINIPHANVGHMKKEELTLPEILKTLGYSTGHFGKWHLGTLTKDIPDANRGGKAEFVADYTIPSEHGYDEFFCTESKVPTYDPMIFPASFQEGESKRYGWRAIESQAETKAYGTAYWFAENQKEEQNLSGDNSRIIMDRVIPFIEKSTREDHPFFTSIWFHTPHLPVVSDSLHRALYKDLNLQKQIYYGTITAMDEQIGRLWNKLETLGIAENTILFYCSDNGPENRTPGSAGPFRERKRSLYEGGLRVPAFVIWKKQWKGGKRIHYPAVTSDYLPTLLNILDLEYPTSHPIDGTSILAALDGTASERSKPIGFIFQKKLSWVNHQYKLISTDNQKSFELYDLLKDKAEQENIIAEFPEIAERMKAELELWLESVERSGKGADYK